MLSLTVALESEVFSPDESDNVMSYRLSRSGRSRSAWLMADRD